jgi:hypothetical protein
MQSTQKPALNEYPCRYGFFQLYTNLAGLIITVPIFDKIRMDESFSTPVHIIIQGLGYFLPGFNQSLQHPTHHGTLQAKWQVPGIAQKRHLKYLKPIDKRNTVNPSGITVIVPHFPKETAN